MLKPTGSLANAKTAQDTLVLQHPESYQRATPEQIPQILQLVARGLDARALGLGIGLAYTPAAGRDEIFHFFQTAASYGVASFVHVRHASLAINGGSIDAAREVLDDTAAAGASLHIVYVTSTAPCDTPRCST